MSDQFHTEGYIKEIKLNDQGISVKLDPSEKFSFGDGESRDKKLVLLEGESEYKAELIAQSVEFQFGNRDVKESDKDKNDAASNAEKPVGVDANLLFVLKKDRAKLRVSVEKMDKEKEKNKKTIPVYTITAITIL